MLRSLRFPATLVLLALALVAASEPAGAATRKRRATAHAAPAAPRIPTWVAPFKTITSADGRFTACNYNMRQEGWGALMLFQEGHLIRVWQGLRAVSWEPGSTRLLATEARPDDDLKWFMIDPSRGGDDADLRDLPRTPVLAGRRATFRGWLPDGRLTFGEGIDATARDTVDAPSATPH